MKPDASTAAKRYRPDLRFSLWGIGVLLFAAAPAVAGFVGFGWELAQIAGLISTAACVLLCGCPVRPRNATPATLLSLRSHEFIGWTALLAGLCHAGGSLLADPTVIDYLKLTTPVYQGAGVLALVLMMGVVSSSVGSARRRLWNSHRGFQAVHVTLGCALVALIAIHVAVTDRYAGGGPRRALFTVITIGAITLLLRARRRNDSAPSTGKARTLVFGRHSTWIMSTVIVATLAVSALQVRAVRALLREPLQRRSIRLPLIFPHEKHATINCLICHHNYADGSGADSCVPCHRSARTDLKAGAESRFHGFCLECHRHPDSVFKGKHGPVSGCVTCHRLESSTLIASSDAATPLK